MVTDLEGKHHKTNEHGEAAASFLSLPGDSSGVIASVLCSLKARHEPVIVACAIIKSTWRLRQEEDREFRASLGYEAGPVSNY